MRQGDPSFEPDDPRGRGLDLGNPCELQHRGDMGQVAGSDLRHPGRGGEVVVTIGHAEPALQQERRVAGRVVQVLGDPQTEQVVGVEIGAVEHVDVGAQQAPESSRECLPVRDRADGLEGRSQGLELFGLDRGLVHEARIVVADLLGIGARRALGLGRLGDEIGGAAGGQLREHVARAPRASIGGDLGALDPCSVRVGEEVVSRSDAPVDAPEVDAAARRGRSFGAGKGGQGDADADDHERSEEAPEDVHGVTIGRL